MAVITHGLAFGLTWYTSTSDHRDELRKEAKKLKANVYTEAIHESSRMYGFGEVKKWKGVHAAAAAVAEAIPGGGLFVHRLDANDTTCLIMIDGERSLPMTGLDLTGTREAMIERAKAIKTENYGGEQGADDIMLYGDVDAEEIAGCNELPLARVASEAISGALKPVRPFDVRLLFPVALVIGITAVVFSDDLTALVMPAPTKPVVSLEVQYRNMVTTAVNQVVAKNQFPADVMAGFLQFIPGVASEAAGWRIENLKCTDADCVAIWRRQPGATSEGFLQAMKLQANDPTVTFYDVDFVKRTMTFKKATSTRKLMLAPNGTFAQIVGTWLQRLADRKLERPALTAMAPLVPSNGAKLSPADIPQVGTYRFTVPFSEADLSTVANLPDLMTIETIDVRREGEKKMVVQFNGNFYAL